MVFDYLKKFILFLFLFGTCSVFAAEIKLPDTADNSIVIYPGEEHLNAGKQSRIRIKGNQHLVVIKFDTKALAGALIESAELVCEKADNVIEAVSISTIAADWDENKSSAMASGTQLPPGWGWPRGRFMDVCGSNSFSLVCFAKSQLKDGRYHWQVDPDLIYANVLGLSHGLVIQETLSDYSRNPTIWSREQAGKAPYLSVKYHNDILKNPAPVKKMKLINKTDLENLALQVQAPLQGFAYKLLINDKPYPQCNIPFVKPGEVQIIPLRDIKLTEGTIDIRITVLNRQGKPSAPMTLKDTIKLPGRLSFPEIKPLVKGEKNPEDIGIIPLVDKYDVQGNPIGKLPADYLYHNEVFDGKTVRLAGAKGEVVGFQVLIPNQIQQGEINCEIPGISTECYQIQYVKCKNRKSVPEIINPTQGRTRQGKFIVFGVDVYIPFKFIPAEVKGHLELPDGTRIPVELRIRQFTLPERASFLCEMNTYGMPDRLSDFYKLQKIAYQNRVHVNILHYGHSSAAPGARKCVLDMRMDMFGMGGRRMDENKYNDIPPGAKSAFWDDFIRAFGPYLSGKYFKNDYRGVVPAPGFYLTFHESWPLNVRAFFNGDPDAYQAFKAKPEYAATFKNILQDFIKTAAREGWTETGFQLYLNNKGKLNDPQKAPWVLDEPASFWDYRALRYFGNLVREAKGEKCPVKIDYRIDISRPQFDRGELWNTGGLWVVNTSAMLDYPRIIQDRKKFSGEKIWIYGTTNPVESSNRETMAWILESFAKGAKGIVPWQTVNKDGKAMIEADQLGLFVFAAGNIFQSLRLKAFRRAEQDIEYLLLLQKKMKWTDGQLRKFIEHYLPINGTTIKKFSEDAGTRQYDDLSPENFRQLREAAADLLEKE